MLLNEVEEFLRGHISEEKTGRSSVGGGFAPERGGQEEAGRGHVCGAV